MAYIVHTEPSIEASENVRQRDKHT